MLAQTSNRLPNMINMSNCYQCNVTPGMACGQQFQANRMESIDRWPPFKTEIVQ